MSTLRIFIHTPARRRIFTIDCGGQCECSSCRSRPAHDDFVESEHPRDPAGKFRESAGGGGSDPLDIPDFLKVENRNKPMPKAEARKIEPKAEPFAAEPDKPEFQSKKEHAQHLLERGVTTQEMLAALGWPSISMPAMAKSLGMNLEKVKEGRTTRYKGTPMSAKERAAANLPPPGVKRSGGPASRPKETWSLLEFIASEGGIDPKDALISDVRSAIGTKQKFVPGFGSLIRPGGIKLDKLREKAVEAGYMYDPGFGGKGQQQTTIRSLIDTMDRELRGNRVYRGDHTPEHAKAARQEAISEENRRHYEDRLDEAMSDVGMDLSTITGEQRDRVLQIMEKEGITDPLEAIEREAMEWVTDAAANGKAERILDDIPGWDVPTDAGPASRTSSTAAPF